MALFEDTWILIDVLKVPPIGVTLRILVEAWSAAGRVAIDATPQIRLACVERDYNATGPILIGAETQLVAFTNLIQTNAATDVWYYDWTNGIPWTNLVTRNRHRVHVKGKIGGVDFYAMQTLYPPKSGDVPGGI